MQAMGRRAALQGLAGLGLGGLALSAGAGVASATTPVAPAVTQPATGVPTAAEALDLLVAGNRRWQEIHPEHPHEGAEIRRALVASQHPFATILSCVDSRVPPELVFDQGLGDLFTVRTAGEVLDEAVLGSVAFGAGELGIPLVLVLGHSSCGAVGAALDAVDAGEEAPGHLAYLVEAIAPSVPPQGPDRATRIAAAVDANVRAVVDTLRHDEDLAEAVSHGDLTIVGARYDLDSGAVTLL
ncbi:carbonic anhydrase [Pseudonocardia pini]|uniref:carbonic anhydrase n=1 Tax=Pseudonocardia pini TaxID=2758030 RepID=UPI0015F075E0|nr:carbonic anhydrase [Pseudonocardia pini]